MTLMHRYIIFFGWIFKAVFRIRPKGWEGIPDGGALICSNHTSLLDPVFVILGMRKKAYSPTKLMAKIELSRVPVLSFLISSFLIYVDRGKSDIGAIKSSISCLKEGDKLILFPEGRRVSEEEQSQAKTGAALIALKSGVPIVPVYVTKGKKPMFSFKRVDVVFGEPYYADKAEGLSTSEAYRKIADDLMERIGRLAEQAG